MAEVEQQIEGGRRREGRGKRVRGGWREWEASVRRRESQRVMESTPLI